MASEYVISVYKAHEGKEKDVEKLLEKHSSLLRKEKFITERPYMVLRSPIDGAFIEIFEWASEKAVSRAHNHEGVMKLWDDLGVVANFMTLADLKEAKSKFPAFRLGNYEKE